MIHLWKHPFQQFRYKESLHTRRYSVSLLHYLSGNGIRQETVIPSLVFIYAYNIEGNLKLQMGNKYIEFAHGWSTGNRILYGYCLSSFTDCDSSQIFHLSSLQSMKADIQICIRWLSSNSGVLKTKTPKTPKTPKLENKDPSYFSELRNYDQPVANATESWALATRILRLLLASWTDIIWGIFFVLNWKILCFVSSKELTPCLFEVFNFHRK